MHQYVIHNEGTILRPSLLASDACADHFRKALGIFCAQQLQYSNACWKVLGVSKQGLCAAHVDQDRNADQMTCT